MRPKFSIITPSFNQGRFLPDCIKSVISQSGVDVEHIVIDAGSTDETIDVLKNHSHLQWVSEADAGMSDGINKGFLKATGDWVMWLNCDDFLLPGALAKVAEFIRKNPEVDIVHGDCNFVRADKSLIRRKYDHPVDGFTLLLAGCCIPSTSTFLHRRIIETGHLLDISYKVCMDWEYYLRLIRNGYRFGYLRVPLAGFRWHGDNTSVVHSKRGEEEALLLQREHLDGLNLPSWLGLASLLSCLRWPARAVRVLKRLRAHGRLR
jgi:glycosyltransferase involved in cell wall biosynthesis